MSVTELTPEVRRKLIGQLDSARRAVGAARVAGDPGAEAEAHSRVHLAKHALGARGDAWWQTTTGRRTTV